MENLSPSRIEPLSPSDQSNSDDGRPRKAGKARAAAVARNVTPPPIDVEEEETARHKLDERA